jgi:PKD repeat protein
MKIKTTIFTVVLTAFTSLLTFSQTVTSFMGIGHSDWAGTFTNQTEDIDKLYLSLPQFGVVDNNGRFYISEKHKIRLVSGTRAYNRAGSLGQPSFAEGYVNNTGTQATFRTPSGMAVGDDNAIYIVDNDNHCIRRLAPFVNVSNAQAVTTFAGAAPTSGLPGFGTEGSADGQGTAARFSYPRDIVRDASGNFYVSDGGNFTIRKISNGFVGTLAGAAGQEGFDDGSTGASARFGDPYGLALLNNNTLVVSDRWNTCIRTVNTITGETKTIAGPKDGGISMHKDGTLDEARFVNPRGVVVVAGLIYVADENTIRRIDIDNNSVTTFAGNPNQSGTANGTGSDATFTELYGIFTDGTGHLYTVENSDFNTSNLVRKVTIDELVPTADFEANKRSVVIDEVVTITDKSTGEGLTSWEYVISPSNYQITEGSLNSPNFKVRFPTVGFYEMSLTIDGAYGENSISRQDYIAVSTTSVERYKGGLFTLYPNPSSGQVSLKIPENWAKEQLDIEVLTTDGKVVYKGVYSPSIALNYLSNGMYFMTISGKDFKAAERFILNK